MPEVIKDFSDVVNSIIRENMPAINQVVARVVKDKGLDPAGGSSSFGPEEVATIGIGIRGLSVDASCILAYSVEGLTGLSQTAFTGLSVNQLDISADASRFSGTGSFNLGTSSSLHAYGSGTLGAKGCVDIPIDGEQCETLKASPEASATIDGYNVNGEVSVAGTIDDNEITIRSVVIGSANVVAGNVSVKLHGLGPFDSIADDVGSAFSEGFAVLLTTSVSLLLPLVSPAISDSVLPITENVNP